MKLKYTFCVLITLSLTSYGQNVGIGTSSPNALLDVSATNNGILIPRVALTGTGSASPLTSPATSTMIYNTATVTNVTPGYYYWSGTVWIRLIDNASIGAATTVGNTSSANTLSTTVNGVTGATVPMVNSISNTSSANTLSTTVNGVTGTGVNIINNNTLGLSGNTLTSTVNGVAPTQSLSGLSLSGDVTGTLAGSSVAKIQGTGVAISSLVSNNLLQYNGTNWVNVTPASVLGAATTNTLSLSTNTLTSTVNGIAATSSAVSGVSNTSSTNTLSTTVNGVTGTGVNIINSNALGLSGTTLTSTINGVASSGLNLSSIDNNIYNSDGTLTGNRTVTMGGNTLNFTGGNVGIGTSAPASVLDLGNSTSRKLLLYGNSATAMNTAGFGVDLGGNGYSSSWWFADGITTGRAEILSWNGTVYTPRLTVLATGNVGIGTGSPAAALDITSTTSGFLPPRLAAAPATPAQAMVYYNTATNCLMMYNGSSWQSVSCCSPGIIVPPTSSATICSGNGTATFVVAATGAGLTYQWQEFISSWNNITNGGVYSGATTSTLTITNPPSSMNARQYQCIVSGTCSPSVTSSAATLTVHASSIPITITNSQSSATPTNYQQMLTINSSAYAAYESAGLQNVEFSTGPAGTGTVLQAWIESGATNASTSTVYWVNLGSNIIAASGGTLTIYMDFMPTTVMSAAGPTGEAPQLFGGSYYATSYGQYDNGANVFTNYWNFKGTSSAGWTTCGTQTPTFNNGLTLYNAGVTQGGVYSSTTISSGIAIDALLSSGGGGAVDAGGYSSITFTEDIVEGPRWGIGATGSCSITGWPGISSTNAPVANTKYVVTGYYISGGSTLLVNYSSICTAPNTFSSPTNVYLHSYYANLNAYVQWLRTRAYPPGATMPGVTMGSVGCY